VKPSALDNWGLARALANQHLNGELAQMSDLWKPLAEKLVNVPIGERSSVLEWSLLLQPDRDAIIKAIADVDPLGPPPAQIARRLTANLNDLAGVQGPGRFIWPNHLVRAHFNLLSSDPKLGKTYLTLWLAYLIYHELPWPDGQQPTFPFGTKTLWICGDRHQDELRDYALSFGMPPDAILLNAFSDEPYGGWDLDNPDNAKLLRDRVQADRPGIVVIDTVWRATRRKLSKEDEVNLLMDPPVSIAQDCDTTILGLMHLSKDHDTLGRRLEGLARAILKLTRPDPAQINRRKLAVTGNFKEPPALGVTLRDGGCDFDSTPPEEAVRNTGGRPPVKIEKAVAFIETELSAGDSKGCELIKKWLATGESKDPNFRAKDSLIANGRLVVDVSRKPEIWHLIASDASRSETV
jgi:hypothetical protein